MFSNVVLIAGLLTLLTLRLTDVLMQLPRKRLRNMTWGVSKCIRIPSIFYLQQLERRFCTQNCMQRQAIRRERYMVHYSPVSSIQWTKRFLRIPDSYDAKIAKICNFWTFWPVIKLINHLFKIYGSLGKRAFCRILNRGLISWITGQNVQRLLIFTILAS